MALLERCADDAGELRGEHAVEPTGIAGRKAAEQLNAPVEHIEQLVFGEVGENVEQDRIAVLDTTREVEDSDARDTEGSKQHFTVFVPELIMIVGERQAGTDAQAIQRLECRLIANDRCRYGTEDGAQRVIQWLTVAILPRPPTSSINRSISVWFILLIIKPHGR